ncbi:MAG: NAD(P)-dependent oxidoreductase, partial [Floccifex sp.]
LVVGGGKKAWELGKQFENVKYISPNFIEEIPEEARIYKHYEKEDLHGIFFCIAASVRSELNRQVILDCKEKNIICASIQNDENASIQLLHELDFEYLHLAYQTKNTTSKYYDIFDEEFKSIYLKHEPILKDIQFIFEYCTSHFDTYKQRQEKIDEVLTKESGIIHSVVDLMKANVHKIYSFAAEKSMKNKAILDSFFSSCENKYPYMFYDENIIELVNLLELDIEFVKVDLNIFSIDELRNIMKTTPYAFYILDMDVSEFRKKLTRSYKTYQIDENIPDINKKTCLFTLLDANIELSSFHHLDVDPKCLMQQDFFIPLLKEKLNIQ